MDNMNTENQLLPSEPPDEWWGRQAPAQPLVNQVVHQKKRKAQECFKIINLDDLHQLKKSLVDGARRKFLRSVDSYVLVT